MAFYGLLSAPEPPTQRAALAASSTSEIEMVAEIEVAPRSEIVDTMLPHVLAPVAASTRYSDLETAEAEAEAAAEAEAEAEAAAEAEAEVEVEGE